MSPEAGRAGRKELDMMGACPEALAEGWDRQKQSLERKVTFRGHTKRVAELRACAQLSHPKSRAPALPEGARSPSGGGMGEGPG